MPTQNAQICPASIHICRLRITLLNADGTLKSGINNSYVTDKVISIDVKPNIESGEDKVLVSGCDCIAFSYRGYDKLKRFDLTIERAALEPALESMMLGGAVILDNSTIPVPIGAGFPDNLSCTSPVQPPVAVEAWSDNWVDDRAISPLRYTRWVWPMSFWAPSDAKLENDFFMPTIDGFTRSNPAWGAGPYLDNGLGVIVPKTGGWFFTDQSPRAACGYRTVGST
jgi:hypothetical protein